MRLTDQPAAAGSAGRYNSNVDASTLTALPGAELVLKGLHDLEHGLESTEALLVQIGASKLRSLGLDVPVSTSTVPPEQRLYARLQEESGAAAHSRHNALVRRLVSFERALACGRP
jgi:hypothetical protein